jgi:site-specific recombinase XerD
MRENVMKNETKVNGRLSNEQTIKPYRRNIDKFCDWAEKECGIRRERDVAKKGYSYTSLIQKYADHLVAQGLKPTSVHTYLAPVCKGLGVGMEQITKLSRLSKDIVKNTKVH